MQQFASARKCRCSAATVNAVFQRQVRIVNRLIEFGAYDCERSASTVCGILADQLLLLNARIARHQLSIRVIPPAFYCQLLPTPWAPPEDLNRVSPTRLSASCLRAV